MIQINLDINTGVVSLAQTTTVKAGVSVPVQVTLSGDPGATPVLQIALCTQSSAPQVLAYLETFTAQNATTYTGVLNTNDTRLVDYLIDKQSTQVDLELQWTLNGQTQCGADVALTVESRALSGPGSSEGGPVYLTQAQSDGAYAKIDGSGNVLIGFNARLVPITHGAKLQFSTDGTTWQDGPSWTAT